MSARRVRRWLVVAAIVGTAHALVYAPLVGERESNDSEAYVAGAEALLRGSYTTPIHALPLYEDEDILLDRTGYEIPRAAWDAPEKQAFRTPGYPLVLAALGGGADGLSQTLVVVAQAVLVGAAAYLIGAAMWAAAGAAAGLLSAAALALDPWSRHLAGYVLTEATALFVATAAVFVFVRAWARGPAWWAVAGATAAAAALVRPALLIVAAFPVAAALWRRRLPSALAAVAGTAAVLAPWLAWTASVVGRPTIATGPQGEALLYAAHGSGSRSYGEVANDPAFQRDFQAPHRYAPSAAVLQSDPEAHQRYMHRANGEYVDRARATYGRRLRNEPASVVREYLIRARDVWDARETWRVPVGASVVLVALDAVVLVAAVVGGALLLARGGPGAWLAPLLLLYTLLAAPMHTEARFGMPLRGVLLGLAAVAVVRGVEEVRART